jgi:hypothetical protein
MRILTQKTSAIAIVFGLALWGTACNKGSKHSGDGPVQNAATEDAKKGEEQGSSDQAAEEKKEEEFVAAYSVMNFRQLASTYEQLTGVPMTAQITQSGQNGPTTVQELFEAQLSSLPKNPDPTAISSSQVSAATKLAAAFCDALSLDANLRTQKFPNIDFAAPVADSNAFASQILDTFYGPATVLQGDRPTDVGTVAALTDYLATVPNADTSSVFMGACAATLSSAEFYLY